MSPETALPRDKAESLMRLAGYASVTVACVLILVKGGAYFATDSVSMLASLVDSVLDAFASIVNLLALRHALSPADDEHRFGHGKAEALAGLAQAAFVAGSAVFLFLEASERTIHPRAIANSDVGIAVTLFALAATLVLVLFQRHVARRTGSVVVNADSLHYLTDFLTNGATLAAIALAAYGGWTLADPIFALLIGAYILFGAWSIFRTSFDMLMDHELPEAERERIKTVVMSHPEVRSFHDLRTRRSGTRAFIQVHIDLDGAMTLAKAHDISDEVERRLHAAFPGAEVIIHQDPAGIMEPRPPFAAH